MELYHSLSPPSQGRPTGKLAPPPAITISLCTPPNIPAYPKELSPATAEGRSVRLVIFTCDASWPINQEVNNKMTVNDASILLSFIINADLDNLWATR